MSFKRGMTAIVLSATICFPAIAQTLPTPPGQPNSGPGGYDYPYAAVNQTGPYFAAGHANDNAFRYWLFEPASPSPASAPVVLFLHAFLAYDPNVYAFLIAHIVLKGYTVVVPQYDDTGIDTWNWANNAATAFIDALGRLDSAGRVRPAKDNGGNYLTAAAGHSVGGFLAVVMGAKATRSWWSKLPAPNVIIAFEPGNKSLIPAEDFTRIDPNTKLLIVGGEEDDVVCLTSIKKIWAATSQIPAGNKTFLLARSDSHGAPAQIANHYFPNTNGYMDTAAVDARDYYITFKLSVAALNCTYKGTDCSVAFGAALPEQITMGSWSDGVPLKQMLWSSDPSQVDTICKSQ